MRGGHLRAAMAIVGEVDSFRGYISKSGPGFRRGRQQEKRGRDGGGKRHREKREKRKGKRDLYGRSRDKNVR